MLSLTDLYMPITASPFERSKTYTEILPCDALKPFIRCFWGTPEPVSHSEIFSSKPSLVIPDTCMDIIFYLDYTNNSINGSFCTIDENPYASSGTAASELTSTFAIRFYAWTAVLFSDNSFAGSKNKIFLVDDYFSKLNKKLLPMLMSVSSLEQRAKIAEKYLLDQLDLCRVNNNLMNAIFEIINSKGTMRISELAAKNAVSQKQMERIFNENTGISPKTFSSLVRYQLLWHEACFDPNFNILDAVEKYGYTDQAHLLNEFKKRHSMTLSKAVVFAKR